jgi:hypothetical protein
MGQGHTASGTGGFSGMRNPSASGAGAGIGIGDFFLDADPFADGPSPRHPAGDQYLARASALSELSHYTSQSGNIGLGWPSTRASSVKSGPSGTTDENIGIARGSSLYDDMAAAAVPYPQAPILVGDEGRRDPLRKHASDPRLDPNEELLRVRRAAFAEARGADSFGSGASLEDHRDYSRRFVGRWIG